MSGTSTYRVSGGIRENFESALSASIVDMCIRRDPHPEDVYEATGVAYIAVSAKLDDGTSATMALISSFALDKTEFYWSDEAEFCGPRHTDCPARILDLLSPLSAFPAAWGNKNAADCRATCRAKIKARRDLGKNLTDGITIRFAEPITFGSGAVRDSFVFRKFGRKEYLTSGEQVFIIPDWKSRDFDIIAPFSQQKSQPAVLQLSMF